MVQLDNGKIKIAVKLIGAELCSLYKIENKIEYIWQAEKDWQKHSPILFPIVGTLKENTYLYNGKSYTLPRHGFAREKLFTIVNQTSNSLTFRLQFDDETLHVYPFKFILDITYELIDDLLQINYSVKNVGDERMYFSIGAHPAFNVPLEVNKKYEDYYLEFDKKLTANCWLLDGALISNCSKPFLQNKSKLQLQKSLFVKDAIVFKGFNTTSIKFQDSLQQHGFEFYLNSCPYLGLWAAKNAKFVCIEPWYGIADSVNTNQNFTSKEGIQFVDKANEWYCSWGVRVF